MNVMKQLLNQTFQRTTGLQDEYPDNNQFSCVRSLVEATDPEENGIPVSGWASVISLRIDNDRLNSFRIKLCALSGLSHSFVVNPR
jgi:hypothetical protein